MSNGSTPTPTTTQWLLPIPAREQWENDHGYCGETAIQSIGLYYGAWLSQQLVRKVGGGEILIGINAAAALAALHFRYEEWNTATRAPQFQAFMVWMKQHLLQQVPVIFGTYLAELVDPDYDHIVTAVGVHSSNANPAVYDAQDSLVFNSNFSTTPDVALFGRLGVKRANCRPGLPPANSGSLGGCIPRDYDYGIAVQGLVDAQRVGLPVRLLVDRTDEPNVSQGEAHAMLLGHVLVAGLSRGKRYALLRFDDYSKVPTTGTAAQWLTAGFTGRTDFTATGPDWRYDDPRSFASDGGVYYRCVELSPLDSPGQLISGSQSPTSPG